LAYPVHGGSTIQPRGLSNCFVGNLCTIHLDIFVFPSMLRPLDPFQAKIQGIQSLPGGRIRTFSGKPEVLG
jgi:hypothetical protein